MISLLYIIPYVNVLNSWILYTVLVMWLTLLLQDKKLERESVWSVRGQQGCGDGGHQAGGWCWFVPGEMTSQRLSALLFCRNSEDPIENALLCLFSFWLFWTADSRMEWRREREKQWKRRKRCVEGLSSDGRQVEVSVERCRCQGMKAVGAYDPNSCSICAHCLKWLCPSGNFLKMSDFMCFMHVQLASPHSQKQWWVACAVGSPDGSG